jgi:hypothetical protein
MCATAQTTLSIHANIANEEDRSNQHKETLMESVYYKFVNSVIKDSPSETIKKIANWVANRFEISTPAKIQKHRIELSKKLDKLFNSTVGYGPFKGLKLCPNSWWGSKDRATMLLGIYEKEVLDSIVNLPIKYNTFIDLGAADGYYGIGVLVNNIFERTICYELSAHGREVIKNNASLNNVSTRIDIKGVANKKFYSEIPSSTLESSVLLIDIEGAEFELFDQQTFVALNKSIIIMELHEWLFEDGNEKLARLRRDSVSTHSITELRMSSRDLSIFPELKKFSDNDRWLICSEGRAQLMCWLRFDPN